MAQRRRFLKEFKHEAAQMAMGADLSLTQAAKDLGIHANMLRRWFREQERDGVSIIAGLAQWLL
jgi:transposase